MVEWSGDLPPVQSVWTSASWCHLLRLTLIAELEADVRVTLVSGEEEVEGVTGADDFRMVMNSYQIQAGTVVQVNLH